MKRTPPTKRASAAGVIAGAAARKRRTAAPAGLLAEMEQQRNLLEIQNEELGRAHAELEISHQRFSELHEQAPVGYLTFDAQGCIRAINTEAVRLLGVGRPSAIGKPFVVYVEKADRKKFLEHLWRIRRTPDRVATDLRLVTADRTILQVRMTTGRHQDAGERSSLFLSAIEDVTELRATSAINAHLSAIVASSPDAIMSSTTDGRFLSWNPGAEKIFGYARDEVLGRKITMLAPEDRQEEFQRNLEKGSGGEHVAPFETVRLRKDGTPVDLEVSLFPILDGGRVTAVTAVMRDITERKEAARRLRKKAELLSLAQEGAHMGVFEWDLVTNEAFWMPEMEELMGMKLGAGPNNLEPWFAQIHLQDQALLVGVIEEWAASNQQDAIVHYRFSRDGLERWFELRGRIARDATGKALKMIGTNLDITERKKMEEALRESRRLALSTVEAIPAHIAVVEESGMIISVNNAWREFARANGGTEDATGTGVNYLEICEGVHGMGRRDAAHFAAGMRAVLNGTKDIFSMEYACHSPEERRWFTCYVTPFAGEGARRAVVAHVNITAVKLAEEKFRGVLESAPDAMVITDDKGRIQLVNRRTEQVFGYTRRELVGKTVEMLMPPSFRRDRAARHEVYSAAPAARAMGGGASFPARRKDGSEFPAEISLSPLQTEGGFLVCSTIRDITERKKSEEAIRTLNAELEERVAARTAALQASNDALREAIDERRRLEQEVIEISEAERERIGQDLHDDLGQQLAGLWFFSSTLENNLRKASSPEADKAGKIAAQLDKALALTRSLARGLQPVAAEPGGLMVALDELAGRSSELFKTKCRLKCPHPVEIHDANTATYLYRIAQEAVTNAARHGHARHISILLSASKKSVVLTVNDDGTGVRMPAGKHDGMGIRTMNYRAEALGGSLVFRSRPAGGTSVVCTIPKPAGPATKEH